MQADLSRALAKVDPKEGDIVFFDLALIRWEAIEALCGDPPPHPFLAGVMFIGVCTRVGQSVEDTVFAMSRSELEQLLADKEEEDPNA